MILMENEPTQNSGDKDVNPVTEPVKNTVRDAAETVLRRKKKRKGENPGLTQSVSPWLKPGKKRKY